MKKTVFSASRRRQKIRLAITVFFLIVLGFVLYFALNRGANLVRQRANKSSNVLSAEELWNSGQYAALVEVAEKLLLSDPIDRDALLFAGYSRYFLAIAHVSSEKRHSDLQLAIRHLRRLLALEGTPNPERIAYALGKAYLIKGNYWSDLAVHYLKIAINSGYEPEDIYEHLGQAYTAMGDAESALEWYNEALEKHPTDRLFLIMGKEAFQLGYYNEAASYYQQAIERSRDDNLIKTGLFQLGQLYYDVGNYKMAKGVLERLVSMEPQNTNNLYLFAETLYELGMYGEAKQVWYAIVKIDPRHTGALQRLYD